MDWVRVLIDDSYCPARQMDRPSASSSSARDLDGPGVWLRAPPTGTIKKSRPTIASARSHVRIRSVLIQIFPLLSVPAIGGVWSAAARALQLVADRHVVGRVGQRQQDQLVPEMMDDLPLHF